MKSYKKLQSVTTKSCAFLLSLSILKVWNRMIHLVFHQVQRKLLHHVIIEEARHDCQCDNTSRLLHYSSDIFVLHANLGEERHNLNTF